MKHGKERQMAGEASRNKVNIGASSLILIFIVLCMATFGLLSLSSAQGDLKLAGRNGEAVQAYYEADSRGQQWLKEVDQVLTEEMGEGKDSTQCSLDIKDRLGELYNRETGLISTDIPMDRGQSLRIELVLMCGEKHYDIKSWYVYASDEYEIPEVNSDKFLPIIPLILAGLIPGMNMNKTANRTAIRSTMYNLPVTPEPSVLLFFEMPVSFISPFPFFFGFRQHPELFENV